MTSTEGPRPRPPTRGHGRCGDRQLPSRRHGPVRPRPGVVARAAPRVDRRVVVGQRVDRTRCHGCGSGQHLRRHRWPVASDRLRRRSADGGWRVDRLPQRQRPGRRRPRRAPPPGEDGRGPTRRCRVAGGRDRQRAGRAPRPRDRRALGAPGRQRSPGDGAPRRLPSRGQSVGRRRHRRRSRVVVPLLRSRPIRVGRHLPDIGESARRGRGDRRRGRRVDEAPARPRQRSRSCRKRASRPPRS